MTLIEKLDAAPSLIMITIQSSCTVRHEPLEVHRVTAHWSAHLLLELASSEMSSYDIVSNSNFTISMLPGEVSVGRILPNDLKSCAWPLLKAMFGGGEGKGPSGFFSLTQDATEATLIMDDRCRAAFDEAAGVAAIEYAPNRWRVLELHLGSLAWEVPGLVCFLATLMAESKVSILNLSSNDRDFMLVQESDVASATRVILERLQHDVVGLKADISHKAMVRRSENTFDDDAFDDGHQGSANGTSAVGAGAEGEGSTGASAAAGPSATAASSASGTSSEAGAPSSSEGRVFDSERGLFVQVLPTTLVVVRLQFSMLQACAHALIHADELHLPCMQVLITALPLPSPHRHARTRSSNECSSRQRRERVASGRTRSRTMRSRSSWTSARSRPFPRPRSWGPPRAGARCACRVFLDSMKSASSRRCSRRTRRACHCSTSRPSRPTSLWSKRPISSTPSPPLTSPSCGATFRRSKRCPGCRRAATSAPLRGFGA